MTLILSKCEQNNFVNDPRIVNSCTQNFLDMLAQQLLACFSNGVCTERNCKPQYSTMIIHFVIVLIYMTSNDVESWFIFTFMIFLLQLINMYVYHTEES